MVTVGKDDQVNFRSFVRLMEWMVHFVQWEREVCSYFLPLGVILRMRRATLKIFHSKLPRNKYTAEIGSQLITHHRNSDKSEEKCPHRELADRFYSLVTRVEDFFVDNMSLLREKNSFVHSNELPCTKWSAGRWSSGNEWLAHLIWSDGLFFRKKFDWAADTEIRLITRI